ncbi:MAG TPA: YMGG-like glycine zipper-containing protein [Gemmatimonadaceae bacterium]|nr:YMGG-like glycine zipper-containing protein [Gemmatimonadaceae bacterium]
MPLVVLAFGCKGNDSKKVDDALNSDLSLASQAHPMTPADSVSALERARTNSLATQQSSTAPAVTHRTVVHHVYEGSSGSSAARSSGTHVEKNTNRDAAIGAGAGAIIGAVTSKNKVKGGVIGAAAGGILGAVIGNNVDKKKVPNRP